MNSIFQYAILSSPLNGRIGLLARSLSIHNANGDEKITPLKEGGKTRVEIMVILMDGKRPPGESEDTKVPLKGDTTGNIVLLLVKDLVQRYQGLVGFEIIDKESTRAIDVRLPICRDL